MTTLIKVQQDEPRVINLAERMVFEYKKIYTDTTHRLGEAK